jgi:AraC family transcriptional regulator of adaptative response/methylated-DNA-[protein]-cysteine methyltransferase
MSVLETTFDSGLSSPGRLHDLTVAVDAVTPGELRSRGAGLTIRYGTHDSPFGRCLIGSTDRGVCWLSFHDDVDATSEVEGLAADWANADLVEDHDGTVRWRDRIFTRIADGELGPLPVLLAGTNFQLKVWQALLQLPSGRLCSYAGLAGAIGRPSATRAVASAVAANRVAYLIPCHRVIRSLGVAGQYRWGAVRKRALIGWEQARRLGAEE